jgi:hypothetical protein
MIIQPMVRHYPICPDESQPAGVLAAVKAIPWRAREKRGLDRHSTRQRSVRMGRDMA